MSDDGIQVRCTVQAYDQVGPTVISNPATLTVEEEVAATVYQANRDNPDDGLTEHFHAQVDTPVNPAWGETTFEITFDYYRSYVNIFGNEDLILYNGFSRTSRNWRIEFAGSTAHNIRMNVGAGTVQLGSFPMEEWVTVKCGYDGTNIYVDFGGNRTNEVASFNGVQNNAHYGVFGPPDSVTPGYSPQIRNISIIENDGNHRLFYACDEGEGLVMINSEPSTGSDWDGWINDATIHQAPLGEPPVGPELPNWTDTIPDIIVNDIALPYTVNLDNYCDGATSYSIFDGPGEIQGNNFVLPTGTPTGGYTNDVLANNAAGSVPHGNFNATILEGEIPEVPEGVARLFFTDCIDASVMQWSQADSDLGQVITLYGRHFGSTRGNSFVRIGGVDLTDEKYYHADEPWGETGKPIPFVERITIYIPTNTPQGMTTLSVITDEGESNTVDINIHDVPYSFISPDGSGDGSFESPKSPFGLSSAGHTPGEAIFLKGGIYTARHDGGDSVFWIRDSRYGGLNGLPDRHIKYIGAPGEDAFLFSPTETGQINGINFGAEYCTGAKLRINTIRQACGYNHYSRYVGIDAIGLREYRGSGTGIMTPVGRHHKTFGCKIHGARSDNQQDHSIYVSETTSRPPEDGVEHVGGGEIAWCWSFDNLVDTGGMVIRNMQGSSRIRDGWLSEGMHWHHNYFDGRTDDHPDSLRHSSNVVNLGNDGQTSDGVGGGRIQITPDRIYNNIVIGTTHPDETTAVLSVSGKQSKVYNNVIMNWGSAWNVAGGGISVNRGGGPFNDDDIIEWKNNIHIGTHDTSRYLYAEVESRGFLEADGNLYFGALEGTHASQEVDPTYGDPRLYLDVENGIFRLEEHSAAIGIGVGPLLEGQTYDINAIDYGERIDAGAVLYVPEGRGDGDLFIAFSDLTSGVNSGWSAAEPDKGAAVTIWGTGFGSTRGDSYVTVNGVNLTDDDDYPESWGRWSSPVPFLQRICFHLNSSITGTGTISVTVEGVTSNTIPFAIHTGRILFMDTRDDNGTGTIDDPFQVTQWANGGNGQAPGDICYLREGTYTRGDGRYNFWVSSGVSGTEAAPIALIGYPDERAFLHADTESGSNGMRQNFGGVPSWWVISKFDMYARRNNCNQRTNETLGYCRWVGNHIEGLKEFDSGSGLINPLNGGNKVLGNVCTGTRSGNRLDHSIYPSSHSNCEDIEAGDEIAWNYMYDNQYGRGPAISLNHRGGGNSRVNDLTYVKQYHVHHNFIDARDVGNPDGDMHRGIGVANIGGERGASVTPAEPPLIHNNIIIGTELDNSGDGMSSIYHTDADNSSSIYNNILLGWGRIGVSVGALNQTDFSPQVDVVNNIIVTAEENTWGAPVQLAGSAGDAVISNNNYFGGDSSSYIGDNQVIGDPLLNFANWLISLDSDSPCVGQGLVSWNAQLTVDWNHVPYTDQNDIGAVLADD